MNSINVISSANIFKIGETEIFIKVELCRQFGKCLLITGANAYGLNVWMTLVDRDKFFAESHTYNNYCNFFIAHNACWFI